jgi:RNA polymerase sigma-70 factor (ECF subfamily)
VRTRWECLHEAFDRIVRRADNDAFMHAAARHAALADFADLRDLYAFLLERSGELDARDRVLAALVQLARERDDDVVSALLWLALWPGLCNVYLRRIRRRREADEVISAIALAFTTTVHELDVARVQRVAATLVRNTERRVADLLRAHREEIALDDELAAASSWCSVPDPFAEVRFLHEWLATLLGGDADLLFAIVAFGDTHAEAAVRVGLSPSAARKRLQRAVARLRADAAQVTASGDAWRPAAACA